MAGTPGPNGRSGSWRGVLAGGLAFLLALVALTETLRLFIAGPAVLYRARTIEIPSQMGVLELARHLEDQGVIRNRFTFVALALLRGTARTLKAGEYEIPPRANALAVLALLEFGKVKPHLLVLPEGFTVRELARQLEAEGLAPSEEVLAASRDRRVLQMLGIEVDSLEGYLFPDTYRVFKGMHPGEILARMVQRLREVVTPDLIEKAQAQGLDLHGLLTLASIVEREAVLREEFPLIAAVFWNRLKRDMLLQADPTVAYAVGKDGRAPTRADLAVDSPYNTYKYRGLPPTPIGNPGKAAIMAVLNPAKVNYLYFVSIDDRRHHFSATLDEHNAAAARYRLFRARGLL